MRWLSCSACRCSTSASESCMPNDRFPGQSRNRNDPRRRSEWGSGGRRGGVQSLRRCGGGLGTLRRSMGETGQMEIRGRLAGTGRPVHCVGADGPRTGARPACTETAHHPSTHQTLHGGCPMRRARAPPAPGCEWAAPPTTTRGLSATEGLCLHRPVCRVPTRRAAVRACSARCAAAGRRGGGRRWDAGGAPPQRPHPPQPPQLGHLPSVETPTIMFCALAGRARTCVFWRAGARREWAGGVEGVHGRQARGGGRKRRSPQPAATTSAPASAVPAAQLAARHGTAGHRRALRSGHGPAAAAPLDHLAVQQQQPARMARSLL